MTIRVHLVGLPILTYIEQGSAHTLDLITSFIELREEPDRWRSGLNGRHRLIDLIVQFLVGGPVLGGNRRCDLVGGGVLLQVGLEISKAMPGTDCLSLSFSPSLPLSSSYSYSSSCLQLLDKIYTLSYCPSAMPASLLPCSLP